MTKSSPISEIVGIDTEALPVEEMLTNDQKALLASELTALLNHYNLYPDFPDGYPNDKKYFHFLMIWDDEYSPASFGETHIEFCDYDLDACPFEAYCTICKEMEDELLRGTKVKDDDDFFDVLPENLLPL